MKKIKLGIFLLVIFTGIFIFVFFFGGIVYHQITGNIPSNSTGGNGLNPSNDPYASTTVLINIPTDASFTMTILGCAATTITGTS